MAWNGTIDSRSELKTSMTFTPSSSSEGSYEVTTFTAPRKAVYRFELKGSGGTIGCTDATNLGALGSVLVAGGQGGYTVGYLLLERGETVYIGAGGTCSAAFVSRTSGSQLSSISASNLYFVAGAGGGAGRSYKNVNYSRNAYAGGAGGGLQGVTGQAGDGNGHLGHNYTGGGGGTQSAGGVPIRVQDSSNGIAGSYGVGGAGTYHKPASQNVYAWGGRGGDGYYGGASGTAIATHHSQTGDTQSYGYGGGGGSGYVYASNLTINEGTARQETFTSTTSQGGGSSSNSRGSVTVSYWANVELPIIFNGVRPIQLYFNDVEIKNLYFNGEQLF